MKTVALCRERGRARRENRRADITDFSSQNVYD